VVSAALLLAAPRASSASRWPAPLDRVVGFDGQQLPLRAALDRIGAEGRLRFSYSPELVPLDRVVCLPADRRPLGDALLAVLTGTDVAPVVAGTDQVVLVPARPAVVADATPAVARSTSQLERVVVTGSATGGPQRASPYAIAAMDRRTLASAQGTESLSALLDGRVPGVWLWSQSPTSPLARYGSIRGASSFGVSAPKVYIDGVEVANPLLLRQIDPASVERVEVIRGPQGAALYGADAISGVVQIVTRHDGVGADAPRAEIRGSAGAAASAFADGSVLAQDHALSLRTGSAARSASLGVTVSTLGAFVPGASSRQIQANGGARWVGSRVVLTGTARFEAADSRTAQNPLLAGLVPATASFARDSAPGWTAMRLRHTSAAMADTMPAPTPSATDSTSPQRVRQYTLGATATLQTSPRWTHVLVAGVDGYRLAGVASEGLLVPSATDSALRAARGSADRGTLRLSSTARYGDDAARAFTLTLGAEHSTARERSNGEGSHLVAPAAHGYLPNGSSGAAGGTTWWSNSGVLAQGQLAVHNALFVSGGARAEYISGPWTDDRVALLPMLGASWVRETRPLALKLRAAYGRGIRPARTVARGATWTGGRVTSALTALAPEQQSGIELGTDLLFGPRFALHVTRFDQRASGLVQPVAVLADTSAQATTSGPGAPRVAYELENVGAIDNRGWELQATSDLGPLSLAVTTSLVGSRVHRLASGYQGDLRTGDRILEVPARTYGFNASWTSGRWSASTSVARATDWINYDRLALAAAFAAAQSSSPPSRPPVGTQLRQYWRTYDGVTRLGARGSLTLWRRSALTLSGDNLLGNQLGEPDNITVLPGRTLTLGLRTSF
jgi:iron complex outermembrane receptor protein